MELPKLGSIKLPKVELPKWKLPELKFPSFKIPKLKIGDSTADIPIVQGGMGVGISLSGLASAVANQGGIGVIAANAIGMVERDYFKNGKEANIRVLRKEIRKAKKKTDGIIGVNIMVAVNDYPDLLQVCIEERVDVVFIGAGLPVRGIPIDALRKANVKLVPIVSSGRAVRLIFSVWQKKYHDIPDGVVVEGPKAGGHLGFKQEQISDPAYRLENLVPDVIKALKDFEKSFSRKIPVIAAGGIFTGKDIHKFLKMGAAGVQMASRFVATKECDADIRFKEAYLKSKKEDIIIIKSPVGLPGRAITSPFLERVQSGKRETFRCPWQCLSSCGADKANYCISIALNNARLGNLKKGFAFAGENAYRIKEIVSVKDLMPSLTGELQSAADKWIVNLKNEYEKTSKKLHELKEAFQKLKKDYASVVEKGSKTFNLDLKNLSNKKFKLIEEYMEYSKKLKKDLNLIPSVCRTRDGGEGVRHEKGA